MIPSIVHVFGYFNFFTYPMHTILILSIGYLGYLFFTYSYTILLNSTGNLTIQIKHSTYSSSYHLRHFSYQIMFCMLCSRKIWQPSNSKRATELKRRILLMNKTGQIRPVRKSPAIWLWSWVANCPVCGVISRKWEDENLEEDDKEERQDRRQDMMTKKDEIRHGYWGYWFTGKEIENCIVITRKRNSYCRRKKSAKGFGSKSHSKDYHKKLTY